MQCVKELQQENIRFVISFPQSQGNNTNLHTSQSFKGLAVSKATQLSDVGFCSNQLGRRIRRAYHGRKCVRRRNKEEKKNAAPRNRPRITSNTSEQILLKALFTTRSKNAKHLQQSLEGIKERKQLTKCSTFTSKASVNFLMCF